MNAYELADYLDYKLEDVFSHHQDTIDMLRQQADREKQLEKVIVALEEYIKQQADRIAELEKVCKDLIMANEMFASVYTTPQTKLSDEEIEQIAIRYYVGSRILPLQFARAIETKVRGQ